LVTTRSSADGTVEIVPGPPNAWAVVGVASIVVLALLGSTRAPPPLLSQCFCPVSVFRPTPDEESCTKACLPVHSHTSLCASKQARLRRNLETPRMEPALAPWGRASFHASIL
jgi:hypothetical protein